MKKSLRFTTISIFALLFVALFYIPSSAASTDNGVPEGYVPPKYNDVPAQQFKDVFETETVEVRDIEVTCDSPGFADPFNDTVHFRVFNSTTQETEYEVDTINNIASQTLPPLQLKKNHNYIFFVEDPQYLLGTKKYVHILSEGDDMATEGAGAYDYKYVVKDESGNDQYNKEYKKLTGIKVYRRSEVSEDPRADARLCIGCPSEYYTLVTYKGNPVGAGIRFRLVSDIETITGSTDERGRLHADLLEDITYMVYLDSDTDKYVIDPFPIAVKDKSEAKEGRYAYSHATCARVDSENPIKLYDSGSIDDAYYSKQAVTSLKGRVTVSGMSFRHLLILDRVLDNSLVPEMDGKDLEVISITAVNPHRWEISKLVGTDFSITKKIEHDKLVTHVYIMDDQGNLSETGFKQVSADEVRFAINSLSVYPVVIEYDPDKSYGQVEAEEQAAKEKAEREKTEQERKNKESVWKGVIDKKLPVPVSVRTSPGKKKLTVKWKKLTAKQRKKAGSIKIEVQYSNSKKFPMDGTKSKYASKKKSSVKIGSLKPKKTYYIRVRTVKTVKGVKHVSKWSKVKKTRVK